MQNQGNTETIATETVRSDSQGKKFFFDLNRNGRGVVLKISEIARNGRRNIIMIPADALEAAADALDLMAKECPQN